MSNTDIYNNNVEKLAMQLKMFAKTVKLETKFVIINEMIFINIIRKKLKNVART